jgi:hypothetical protein
MWMSKAFDAAAVVNAFGKVNFSSAARSERSLARFSGLRMWHVQASKSNLYCRARDYGLRDIVQR